MRFDGIGKRQVILAITLLLTLAATAYVWYNEHSVQNNAIAIPATRNLIQPKPSKVTETPAKQTVQKTQQRAPGEVSKDIFAVKKANAAEPKSAEAQAPVAPQNLPKLEALPTLPTLPPLPSPPPTPTAPPLPFKYIGKLGDNGHYTVFISAQNKNYTAQVGDTIIQAYRVDEIKPPVMMLTYLPTNTKQTMQIGETN